MFDEITEISLLYDFYGQLLTERQREAMRLYHEENYSLSEIAAEFGISRQGVHDAIKNAERALTEYETKLGLVRRFAESRKAIAEIEQEIGALEEAYRSDAAIFSRLEKIRTIIEALDA